MALGHVPLADLLSDMIRERARQHPQIAFPFSAGKLLPSYGDSIDLTIYRCVQESLTNAIRHAKANSIRVDLAEVPNSDAGRAGPRRRDSSSRSRTMDAASIPARRPASGCAACRNACGRSAANARSNSSAGGGTSVRVVIPLPDRDGQPG